MTNKLLSGYRIGNLKLKNRVVLAPMTRGSAEPNGQATEDMARYYANFAEGNFGLLITESVYIDETYSQGFYLPGSQYQPGITNESHIESWKNVTEAVHSKGGKIIMQLAHSGALSQGNGFTDDMTVAPSAIKPQGERIAIYGKGGEYPLPKALDKDEIKEIIKSFTMAAINAKLAGFDGVEIHSANGFLPDQFLTDYTNRRSDEYGGSLENRLRFLVEIIKNVKANIDEDFIIGVRISQAKMNNYDYKWPNGEEDAKVIFKSINDAGADYIHTYEFNALSPAFENNSLTLAELAKTFSGLTVIANGGIIEPTDAENILNNGGDLVALAKIALANHDWPKKVQNNRSIEPFTGDILTPTPVIKEKELLSWELMPSKL